MSREWRLVTENYEPSWATGVTDNHVQLLLIEQVADYLNQLEQECDRWKALADDAAMTIRAINPISRPIPFRLWLARYDAEIKGLEKS